MKSRLIALSVLGVLLVPSLPRVASAAEVSFRIQPDGGASQVFLAGEFNGWDPAAQAMTDEDGDGVFEVVLDLAPGRYAYKFVVDGNWIEDAAAAEFVDDGFGGKNSVVVVEGEGAVATPEQEVAPVATPAPAQAVEIAAGERAVRFAVEAPGAVGVFLAGEFNGWDEGGEAMTDEDGDGVFERTRGLAPGRYPYKFVIDGTWKEDATAAEFVDDGFGGKNSVVVVVAGEGVQQAGSGEGGGDAAVQVVTPKPRVQTGAVTGSRSVNFRYQPLIGGVSEVMLAGTFNDWNVGATPMSDADGDGIFEASLLLAPGEYMYKFVVDGNWLTPDDADAYVDDGFGGKNGVLHVDARFAQIDVSVGDGEFYLEGLDVTLNYGTVNAVDDRHLVFKAKAHRGDVQAIDLVCKEAGQDAETMPMQLVARDPVYATYEAALEVADASAEVRFTFRYKDGGGSRWALATGGFAESEPAVQDWPLYSAEELPPFQVPEWAQNAVFYQIFPDRFQNADKSNDQDFEESYYDGVKQLPASGKTNGEYFHFMEDWDDIGGLSRSPYRTDGKPDYYSFYGGDIAGVMQQLPHLRDLGVTVIYFNPVNPARSNHRYDPCDYLGVDPHLADEETFKQFTSQALDMGIRVMVDMAFNHTGDCHFAFLDVIEKWKDSEYYDWYEWKKRPPSYPLPAGSNSLDYYDCWWGFGLHPNLNFDLKLENAQENGIKDIAQANPNWPVVNYILDSADYWLGEMGVSGFRLDVPNEVPFWFWKLFRERCRQIKPDHFLVGEIWGDAGAWINPDVFDAVMNYKYFKDPVVKWIGQNKDNAETFDNELTPGRTRYPIQTVRAQMNLIGSHDTIRFLNAAGGDARRLRLAHTFGMTYVGSPHIYYGDEVALAGAKDPDDRRTFPWSQLDVPARKATLEHYQKLGTLRREREVLRKGSFETVLASGDVYAYVREHEGERIVVALNNGESTATAILPLGNFGVSDGTAVVPLVGVGEPVAVQRGAVRVSIPPVSGVIYDVSTGI